MNRPTPPSGRSLPARPLVLALALLAALALSARGPAQSGPHTLEHDGLTRSFLLHLPHDTPPDHPVPLLLVLHGRIGTGAGTARLTGFDERADEHGFIAVYPDGVGNEWNYLSGLTVVEGADDRGFLLALVDRLASEYAVDEDRIYLAGISNGGFMVQRLACDAPERFAAFASVAAAGFGGMELVCAAPHPVSLLLMHGTEDGNIPWDGVTVERGNRIVPITYPIPDSVALWASHSGCSDRTVARELPQRGGSPGTLVRVFVFDDCPEERELVLYAIVGGGHNWPGVPGMIPAAVAGRVNTDIHASDEIWDFFSRHRRVGAAP